MKSLILCFLMLLVAVQVFWVTVTYYHSHKVRELVFPSFIIVMTNVLITSGRMDGFSTAAYVAAGVIGVITFVFLIIELFRMSREITGASIKEGADILPAGLLYYEDSGIIIIANKTMYELAEVSMGKTLLSGARFWEEVKTLPNAEYSNEDEKETVTVTFENGEHGPL